MYQAHIVHHIPGRMRIKVPFLKGASAYSEQISDLLMPLDGLRQVDFSPLTGSVLLHYDPEKYEHFSKDLSEYVQRAMGMDLLSTSKNGERTSKVNSSEVVAPLVFDTKLARDINVFFSRINQSVRAATDDVLDLKSLLPVGLGTYALFTAGSAMTTPLWVTLGIFSFTSFAILNPVSIAVEANDEKSRSVRRRTKSRKPRTSR
jgi:Heavy metal associated domain 2